MTRFALKGLLGRKLRTALTALAIVLGVAMVSGTYVLTDSIDSAFDAIFTDVRESSTVVVTGKSAFDLSEGSGASATAFDESVLDTVRGVDGVEEAEGSVDSESTTLIDRDNDAIVFGGAPNLGFAIANGDSRFNPLALVSGSWPGPNEVVVDTGVADKKHYAIGQTIGVQAEGPVEQMRISGIVKFASEISIGGATLAGFDLPTAQRLFEKEGKLDEIAVAAEPGVSDTELIENLESVLPDNTQVRSGAQQAAEDASDTNEFISFLQGFLLAFAGIALFVGSFVIANSLSITIAQRTREFATIRTLGGSRRQVLVSIVIESLLVGVVASVIGLFSGLLLAKGLFSLFDAVGFTLPNRGLLLETRTIVVALLVGILVTLIASLRPAIRATRVPPIAAVREGAVIPESHFFDRNLRQAAWYGTAAAVSLVPVLFLRPSALVTAILGYLALTKLIGSRTIMVLLVIAAGFGFLIAGLFLPDLGTTSILVLMGIGTLLIFIGVALFSSRLVRPLAATLGEPAARIGGAAGRLARDNARRNPQRTASTAAALMIGLALVTLVATLAAGITSTFRGSVDEIFVSDYAITAQNNFSPIPTEAAEAAAKADGVAAIASTRTGEARIYDKTEFVTAVDPDAGEVLSLDWTEGSQDVLSELGVNGAFVDDGFAEDHDLTIGSPISIQVPSGTRLELEVKGIFDPPAGGSPFGHVTFSSATFDREYESPRNLYTFIQMRGDVTDANTKALEDSLVDFPNAKAQTRDEFVDNQISGLNQVLNILYVLLALSVIVSLFGIVNTLVLTVFERTRELGMLRAIGMTRRQVRRMIRHESVITALIGGTLGIVLGVVLGALLIARVEFIEFSLPTTQIVVFAILTIVVGIVAAIFPARRAAKLNPLEALQYE